MKILLTGSSGFIGENFINSQRVEMRCVTRRHLSSLQSDVFKVSSINSNTDWNGAFTNIDAVVHLAGLAHSNSFTEAEYRSVNVEGTLKLATEAASSGVKRFVFVSTIAINGSSTLDNPFVVDDKPQINTYSAKSKHDAEIGLKKISQETGLEVVIVRSTLVYGKNAPGNFGSLSRLINKTHFLPFGLIKNRRSFIAVQNLVDLLITCAEHPLAAGHTFLASDDSSISTRGFTDAIAKGLNKSLIQLPVPIGFMKLCAKLVGKSAIAEQLFCNLEVDSSDVHDILDWKPPFTLEEAMASLIENKND